MKVSHKSFINIYGTTNPYIKSFKGVFNRLKRGKVRGCSPISARNFIGQLQMIIYKTTNLINGKIYVGKHHTDQDNYLGSGNLIQLAIKKYGKENFIRETLEEVTEETWIEREKFWIKQLNSQDRQIGYNIIDGGMNPVLSGENSWWSKATEEQRNQHRKSVKVNHHDVSGDKNPMYGVRKGKTWDELYGIERSNEIKSKLSESRKGKRPFYKRRVMIDGVEYESIQSASKITGLSIGKLGRRLPSDLWSNYIYL